LNRFKQGFGAFSGRGLRFLFLEFLIVFLGVYLAFLFQEYGEDRDLAIEREKILVGLKEELEYFRLLFPAFADSMDQNVASWDQLVQSAAYRDFSSWRFIQPQYSYKAVEYALAADAEIIDFETYAPLSQLYLELEKLRQAEELITMIAMEYRPVPEDLEDLPEAQLAHADNLKNLERLRDRGKDRVNILRRIAELAEQNLVTVNAAFSAQRLREIELMLIANTARTFDEQEKTFLLDLIREHFPDLTEAEVREAMDS
jgi:hypothetical protein